MLGSHRLHDAFRAFSTALMLLRNFLLFGFVERRTKAGKLGGSASHICMGVF